VTDEAGNPITEEEIEGRTRSGLGGGILGGLLGGGIGFGLGVAFTPGEDLEGDNAAPLLIPAAIGAALGAFAGAKLGGITRNEAIERIREERAAARSTASLPDYRLEKKMSSVNPLRPPRSKKRLIWVQTAFADPSDP
jgi:hypothetical protein